MTITHSVGKSVHVQVVPDNYPFYGKLMEDRDRLIRINAELVSQMTKLESKNTKSSLWDTIEDVATGASITCPKCGKSRPCICQDA